MSISALNNSNVEVSRAKAEKFVNASDKTVDRLARRNYNKLYREDNKKFDKQVVTTLNTLPFVAVASGLAAGKGKKGALMSGLSWGMALLAPSLVAGANKAFVKNPKVAKAEKEHPMATLTASIVTSVGAYMGLTSLADKAMVHPKVAELGNKVAGKAGEAMTAISKKVAPLAEKVKMPEFAKNAISKIKVPKFAKKGMEYLAKNPVAQEVAGFAKNLGKGIAKNAPTLVVFGTMGAMLANSIASAKKYSGIKAEIKDAQFNTAKNLVNAYSAENAELKAENAKLASADVAEAEEVE